tara:strand:+ start:174 stop:635 length:462 start_codon:yes stop_codon:yes gene_type:complete
VKKFIVVTSLFLSFIFSEDIFSAERSYGFGGEKFPLSFISISGSAHINAHQEIFVAVGSVIFGGGFSVGYKHYKNQASQSSLYASICLHTGIYGDMGHKITAIYPAIGYSLMLSKKVNLNIGGGCHLALKNIGNEFDGKRIFWTPFLNLTFKM